jgi:hypothetical protein
MDLSPVVEWSCALKILGFSLGFVTWGKKSVIYSTIFPFFSFFLISIQPFSLRSITICFNNCEILSNPNHHSFYPNGFFFLFSLISHLVSMRVWLVGKAKVLLFPHQGSNPPCKCYPFVDQHVLISRSYNVILIKSSLG